MRFRISRVPAVLLHAVTELKSQTHMITDEEPKESLRIFVLADTHNRLPESVKQMAKDADEIWHLGDVCAETILDELRAVGPRVTLVRGNCDSNFEWPLVVDLIARRIEISPATRSARSTARRR